MTHEELIEIVGILAVRLQRLENTLGIVMEWLVGEHKQWDEQMTREWIEVLVEIRRVKNDKLDALRSFRKQLHDMDGTITGFVNWVEKHPSMKESTGASLELGVE